MSRKLKLLLLSQSDTAEKAEPETACLLTLCPHCEHQIPQPAQTKPAPLPDGSRFISQFLIVSKRNSVKYFECKGLQLLGGIKIFLVLSYFKLN